MLPVLIVLFIVLPIVELYVIVQVGQAIGILPTIALLVVDSVVGAALARSQGRAVWQRFNLALAEGRLPARETFDGAMVILGGALMVTPGFVTDVFALILLIPATRALIRRALVGAVARRGSIVFTAGRMGRAAGGGLGGATRPDTRRPGGRPPDRGYDYEGSATEIPEPERELPEGREGRGG